MSEKVEHTELPWSVSSLVPADGLYVLDGNYDFVAATAEWADDGTLIQAFGGIEKAIKNSEYIVLACNSYPALLAERDRLREALESRDEMLLVAKGYIQSYLQETLPREVRLSAGAFIHDITNILNGGEPKNYPSPGGSVFRAALKDTNQ